MTTGRENLKVLPVNYGRRTPTLQSLPSFSGYFKAKKKTARPSEKLVIHIRLCNAITQKADPSGRAV
jgi:hypothetical protein